MSQKAPASSAGGSGGTAVAVGGATAASAVTAKDASSKSGKNGEKDEFSSIFGQPLKKVWKGVGLWDGEFRALIKRFGFVYSSAFHH